MTSTLAHSQQLQIAIDSKIGATNGNIIIEHWTKSRARKKGLKWGASCWALALIALPIPIIHFVAVPACVFGGPIVGYLVFKMFLGTSDVTGGIAECPSCRRDLIRSMKADLWPQDISCPGCSANLSLSKKTNDQ